MIKHPSIDEFVQGFLNKDRVYLSKAITLIESDKADHRVLARDLMEKLLPLSGKSMRIGISGTPGVGKSTFINHLGLSILKEKKNVAVLAVDPSSIISGGSILGDKTRMSELAQLDEAFIRPSPSKGTLGGVGRKTREVIFLCEAFGFSHIIVESVGVGQSEVELHEMVDWFVMLLQPGSGDDLQGIKRGILEVVDLVVVHKSDTNEALADSALHHYQEALHVLRSDSSWTPKVIKMSSLNLSGWDHFFELKNDFFKETKLISNRRIAQKNYWLHDLVIEKYLGQIQKVWNTPEGKLLDEQVKLGHLTVFQALELFKLS